MSSNLIFKEIKNGEELDRLSQEIISEEKRNAEIEMAYPEVYHPSFQLANFSVRDDTKTIAAFEAGQLMGLASFVSSKQTFLPPGLLNRIFFIMRREKNKKIDDQVIEKVENAYLKLKVPVTIYTRLEPVEKLSPTGRTLEKHGYKKVWALKRMARTLDEIPKLETDSNPTLRRAKWEEQDLMLFGETWVKGIGWPAKFIEPAARGLTKRLLERNPSDPNTWTNFLVEIDRQPVGTAAFLTFPETAYVVNVSTLKKFRRMGIAAYAMTSLMEWCKMHGMKYMTLNVDPKRPAALRLYRKLDFKGFGETTGYAKKFHYRAAKRGG